MPKGKGTYGSQAGRPPKDGSKRKETYQLGGLIPGQPRFGKRPMVNQPVSPLPTPGRMPGTAGYNYEEGGKVRRKARREKRQEKRNLRKISRLQKKGVEVTHTIKPKGATQAVKESKKLKPTGRIRAGAKSVKVTKGGAYASYGKKSAAAKSFRKAYSKASEGSTFTWDGRKYKK